MANDKYEKNIAWIQKNKGNKLKLKAIFDIPIAILLYLYLSDRYEWVLNRILISEEWKKIQKIFLYSVRMILVYQTANRGLVVPDQSID